MGTCTPKCDLPKACPAGEVCSLAGDNSVQCGCPAGQARGADGKCTCGTGACAPGYVTACIACPTWSLSTVVLFPPNNKMATIILTPSSVVGFSSVKILSISSNEAGKATGGGCTRAVYDPKASLVRVRKHGLRSCGACIWGAPAIKGGAALDAWRRAGAQCVGWLRTKPPLLAFVVPIQPTHQSDDFTHSPTKLTEPNCHPTPHAHTRSHPPAPSSRSCRSGTAPTAAASTASKSRPRLPAAAARALPPSTCAWRTTRGRARRRAPASRTHRSPHSRASRAALISQIKPQSPSHTSCDRARRNP